MSGKNLHPSDLPKSSMPNLAGAFGHWENEVAAMCILAFCQESNNWESFSVEDLEVFCLKNQIRFDQDDVWTFLQNGYLEYVQDDSDTVVAVIRVLVGPKNIKLRLRDPQDFAYKILSKYKE